MTQSTHGLVQSQALTVAAQKLSVAKKAYKWAVTVFPENHGTQLLYWDRVIDAQEDYLIAYQRYTNPFGVEKDGRCKVAECTAVRRYRAVRLIFTTIDHQTTAFGAQN